MRGWTLHSSGSSPHLRGSPAHAGMDLQRAAGLPSLYRLPRACGDGPSAGWIRTTNNLAPPRMRGWTPHRKDCPGGKWGSPAHAGMDPVTGTVTGTVTGLPRACGDGPYADLSALECLMAPPRMRGWTPKEQPVMPGKYGSPAHAGMDPSKLSLTHSR